MKYYKSTWEQERDKRYRFPIICASNMINISKIHPLLQKKADAIYNALCDDKRIALVMVFGSSLNLRCNIWSDIDLAIKLEDSCITNEIKSDVSEKIQTACDWNADILWWDRLDDTDRVLQEIKKGVILQ